MISYPAGAEVGSFFFFFTVHIMIAAEEKDVFQGWNRENKWVQCCMCVFVEGWDIRIKCAEGSGMDA